jgi:hypothetical protein
MSEESLEQMAQAAVGSGEEVLAAGVFEPRGTSGAGLGALDVGHAAGGLAGEVVGAAVGAFSGRVMAEADAVPRWTLMAVTPAHLYAFVAHGQGIGWRVAERFAVWDRDKIAFTVHGRVGQRIFEVEDLATGRRYEFETARFGPAHGSVVIKLLEQEQRAGSR